MRRLGDGFTSDVFLCFDNRTGDEVAVKILKKSASVTEFFTEVSMLRKSH